MDLLTTAEAAEYLRLKERKLYELVSQGAIPCTKVTGKWLFPKAELDHWLASSLVRPDGLGRREPMPIVGGSHDPLLEWALRESGSGLATLPEGSEAGLARFVQGELVAAAIHLHGLERGLDANVETMRRRGNLHDAVLVAFGRREQGLVLAAGNPLGLHTIADVVAHKARMAMRPRGAGAQLLLLALLAQAGLRIEDVTQVNPPCPTGPDIAQAVRTGRADCGIATRSVTTATGLAFVPLTWEHFDLVVRQRDYFRESLQRLLACLGSPAFHAHAQDMGGYDVSEAGKIRYAP
jgi:excisionase family DNA binding protein